jgi:Tfp pilus assembly protein PilO
LKEYLARISAQFSRLSSAERWLIIFVIIAVFAVVNFWFIFPRFDDWNKLGKRMKTAQATLQTFEEAIDQNGVVRAQIAKMEGENAAVPAEDQAVNFLNAIQNQAVASRVSIVANNSQPQRTNQFFLERIQSLTTSSREEQLVDFLYNLGAGNSQIRVRALSIRPDPQRQALNTTINLLASFQKKAPAKSAAPAPVKPAPAPASAAATKTNTTKVVTNKPTALPAPKPGPAAPTNSAKPSTPKK